MNELKARTMEVINAINQGWVSTIREAEKKQEGIDMTGIMGKFSEHIKKLDQYFQDAAERLKRSKKKGIFG